MLSQDNVRYNLDQVRVGLEHLDTILALEHYLKDKTKNNTAISLESASLSNLTLETISQSYLKKPVQGQTELEEVANSRAGVVDALKANLISVISGQYALNAADEKLADDFSEKENRFKAFVDSIDQYTDDDIESRIIEVKSCCVLCLKTPNAVRLDGYGLEKAANISKGLLNNTLTNANSLVILIAKWLVTEANLDSPKLAKVFKPELKYFQTGLAPDVSLPGIEQFKMSFDESLFSSTEVISSSKLIEFLNNARVTISWPATNYTANTIKVKVIPKEELTILINSILELIRCLQVVRGRQCASVFKNGDFINLMDKLVLMNPNEISQKELFILKASVASLTYYFNVTSVTAEYCLNIIHSLCEITEQFIKAYESQ